MGGRTCTEPSLLTAPPVPCERSSSGPVAPTDLEKNREGPVGSPYASSGDRPCRCSVCLGQYKRRKHKNCRACSFVRPSATWSSIQGRPVVRGGWIKDPQTPLAASPVILKCSAPADHPHCTTGPGTRRCSWKCKREPRYFQSPSTSLVQRWLEGRRKA